MTTGTIKAVDHFVKVGDLNLHYLEWGAAGATPVVMIHGLTGNAHAFDILAPHFLPGYHVISLDVRGRGDSEWAADGDYSNDCLRGRPGRVCDRPSVSSASRWWAPPWGAAFP